MSASLHDCGAAAQNRKTLTLPAHPFGPRINVRPAPRGDKPKTGGSFEAFGPAKFIEASPPFGRRGSRRINHKSVNPAACRRGPGSGSSVAWPLSMPEKIPPHNNDFKRRVSVFQGGVR
jgi:hypothetical protein